MTAAQARRYRKKIFRGERTATASDMHAVDGLPGTTTSAPVEEGSSPASPAVQRPAAVNRPEPLRPGT